MASNLNELDLKDSAKMSLVVMAIQSDYGSARRMDQWIHRFFSPRAPVAKKVIHPAMDASGVKRRPEAVKFFFFS